jgi:hypothetical protein
MKKLMPLLLGAVGAAAVLIAERVWDEIHWKQILSGITHQEAGLTTTGPLFETEKDRECGLCTSPIFSGSLAGFYDGDLMCEDCWDNLVNGEQ